MKTDDLIKALDADTRGRSIALRSAWWGAVCIAAVIAAGVFFITIGPRPDIGHSAQTVRFLFKFVFTAVLAISAFFLLRALSTPGAPARRAAPWLATAPLLMAVAIVLELLVIPSQDWGVRLVGHNSVACMGLIPLIGIGPLAVFLTVLRYGAPTRPMLAGAVAGLLAGGLAATFYAAHCTDDSPLFVATWYTIAITGLAGLGALGGRLFVRW